MADTPTRIEVDCSTGEVKEIPLTPAEIAAMDQQAAEAAAQAAAKQAADEATAALKASAKAKLVAGQPLTAEEASLLVL